MQENKFLITKIHKEKLTEKIIQFKHIREKSGATLLSEYFVQFGIIIFPITVYQIWTFGKSFTQLPLKALILGIYGGVSAILCQSMPVYILGKPENFQCVPIILSILYGKRKAGILSIGILVGYQLITPPNMFSWIWSVAAILIYSVIPMAICKQFNIYSPKKRFMIAQLLSFVTLIVELLFLIVYFSVHYGKEGLHQISQYFNFLSIASVIQLCIMGVMFFLLESIIENGRIRKLHESLIKFNPLGICAFNTNDCFVAANSAYEAITGYKEAELLGKSRLLLWPENDHNHAREILEYVLHGEIKQNVEVALKHKNGHRVPVRFTLVPIMDGETIVGYFAMVTDITESKTAEEFVRNSEKLSAIGQLAAGVAHEIRNPLTAIKGFLQLLSSSCLPSQTQYYDIMKSEISRIEGIVSEMLVLAKPQAVSFKTINVKEKLEEVEALLEAEANMRNVEIAVDFSDSSPIIMADGNQLKQVFLNMGKNAIEAMPKGGKLTISMCQEKDKVKVKFVDNGNGIPKEILQKIGEPFFTTKTKGTGLGLLISKRIITSHKGTMNIKSAPGEGTTVEVLIPLHKKDDDVVKKQLAVTV